METQSPAYSQDDITISQEILKGIEEESEKSKQATSTVKLSFWQKLILLVKGHVRLDHKRRPDWSGSLPIYAFRCPIHGIQTDYIHGFYERLDCPLCSYSIEICPQETNLWA